MTDGRSASWRLKIARARHHLAEFEVQASAIEQASREHIQSEREGNDVVLRVRGTPAIGDDVLLTAGDAIHNARTALDHLICDLAWRGQGTLGHPPTDDEERALQFPLNDREEQWAKSRKTLRRYLSDTVLDALELEQPWRIVQEVLERESAAFSHRELKALPAIPSLRRLSKLDNIDKHRRLSLALWYPGTVGGESDLRRHREDDEDSVPIAFEDLPEEIRSQLLSYEPEPTDAEFYFMPGPVTDGSELGRWMRNDRAGPVGEVPGTACLRLVMVEAGLTGVVDGAPPAAISLRLLIDDAEDACSQVWAAHRGGAALP
jgi:hypothetical protein